jgi:hypothetical protein
MALYYKAIRKMERGMEGRKDRRNSEENVLRDSVSKSQLGKCQKNATNRP